MVEDDTQYCWNVQADFPDAPACCGSCHEDEDEYGYDLSSFKANGVEYYVCCAISLFIDSKE